MPNFDTEHVMEYGRMLRMKIQMMNHDTMSNFMFFRLCLPFFEYENNFILVERKEKKKRK